MASGVIGSRRGRPGLSGLRAHLAVPLFLNAYLLMISSAAQSGLGLVFWAVGARLYSPHWVGDSTTVISVALLLTSIGQLGLSSVIVRYLPVAHSGSRRFVIGCYVAAIGVSLGATAVAIGTVSLWAPPLVFLRDNGWWLLLFVLSSVTGTIFQLEDAVMVGLRRTKWVPVENITFAVSRVVLIIVLAHILTDSGIVLASAIPSVLLPIAVNIAIFASFLPRHQREAGDRRAEWQVRDVRKLVFGNYVGSLAEMGSLYLLPVIITDKLGPSSEAYFYIPWQLMTGLTVLAANMSASLSVETAGGAELRRHVLSALKFVLGVLVAATVVIGLGAHYLLLIFGAKYAAGGEWALRWMLLATIPTGITMVGLAVARIHHNGRLIATAQVLGAGSLILITFLLLPDYGVEGAGVAALLSATLSMGVLAPTLWEALSGSAPVQAQRVSDPSDLTGPALDSASAGLETSEAALELTSAAPALTSAAPEIWTPSHWTVPPVVLVVEDQPALLDFIARGLRREGLVFVSAADDITALERARDPRVKLMVLDLMRSALHGADVLATVHLLRPDLPVIVVGSGGEAQDDLRGRDAGVVDHLLRPVSLDELPARVRDRLAPLTQASAS